MNITLLHNPNAGNGALSKSDLVGILENEGHRVTYYKARDAELAKALESPGDIVLVAGGDGTVRNVGIALMGRDVPMAILPLGTANNVSQALGITGSPREIAAHLDVGKLQSFDVGTAASNDHRAYFLESCGCGLFANLLARLSEGSNPQPHMFPDPPHQIHEEEVKDETLGEGGVRLLQKFLTHARPIPLQLDIDGQNYSGKYLLVEAMNIHALGANLNLAPAADPGDGLLNVLLLSESDYDQLETYLNQRRENDQASFHFPSIPATRVTIRNKETLLHTDDKLWPSAEDRLSDPIEISVDPGALTILVPQHGEE